MANPFDAIDQHVTDLHHQAGWIATVYNDAGSAESDDWVDRSSETDDYTSGTDVTIRIEWSTETKEVRDAAGRETFSEVVIVGDPAEANYTAGDDTTLATEIEDTRNGNRYRVLRVRDQDTGLVRMDAESV